MKRQPMTPSLISNSRLMPGIVRIGSERAPVRHVVLPWSQGDPERALRPRAEFVDSEPPS